MRPWRTIIVATQERSGSNLLADYMGQTDQLGQPWEFFSRRVMAEMFNGRGSTTLDRCQLVLEKGQSSNGVAAIKLFPPHFSELQEELRISEWFGTPCWVWLRRRDLIGQAISFVLARQQRSFTSSQPAQATPTYSADEINETLTWLTRGDALWRAYFSRARIEPITVFYEELERDPNGVLRAIAEAAGVGKLTESVGLATRFSRQRNALNEEWRERFHLEMGQPDRLEIPARSAEAAPSQDRQSGSIASWPFGRLLGPRRTNK